MILDSQPLILYNKRKFLIERAGIAAASTLEDPT
jgi:hypothetical protein